MESLIFSQNPSSGYQHPEMNSTAAAVFFTQTQRHEKKKVKRNKYYWGGREKVGHTELIFHKVVERMPITSVSEFVVVCRQLLQTLHCNCAKVAREGCIVCKHHCASGYKAVDKRVRPHPLSHAFSLPFSLSLSLAPLNPILFPLHRNTLPSSVSWSKQQPSSVESHEHKLKPFSFFSFSFLFFFPLSFSPSLSLPRAPAHTIAFLTMQTKIAAKTL